MNLSAFRNFVGQVLFDRQRKKIPPYRRFCTASMRRPPDFLIIGGNRCGTTSLFRYLMNLEHLISPCFKEIHYFDLNYQFGDNWYLANFPLTSKFKSDDYITGEASPNYLYNPKVPGRIRNFDHELKLVVLLRNPIERALSQFIYNRRRGMEHRDMEVALSNEMELVQNSDNHGMDELHRRNHVRESYVRRSLYHLHLKNWFEVFDRDNFYIRSSEDLFQDVEVFLNHLCRFLGVPFTSIDSYEQHNASERMKVDPAVREELKAFFEPHNQQLQSLIDKDFGWLK